MFNIRGVLYDIWNNLWDNLPYSALFCYFEKMDLLFNHIVVYKIIKKQRKQTILREIEVEVSGCLCSMSSSRVVGYGDEAVRVGVSQLFT
ncbi:uncharacterized protein G2W53_024392 [Senna tora]|uniref:Uncharacterized protein n=1 Tax=Senna tora TaxID=362788 RepID=A0A834TBH5_9FABA|nr:uncharacterized protein G2W53_024392 [Senna tora]